MFHVVVLFPSFRIWKWWRYPLTAETESIDSEKWLFDYKLQEYKDRIPNLISRRQFNDRRKKTAGLCENCASGLPWKWMAERNNSLLTPSR